MSKVRMKYSQRRKKYKINIYDLTPVPFYVRCWDHIGNKLNLPVWLQWKVRNVFTRKVEWVDKPQAVEAEYGLCHVMCGNCGKNVYLDYEDIPMDYYRDDTPIYCPYCKEIVA